MNSPDDKILTYVPSPTCASAVLKGRGVGSVETSSLFTNAPAAPADPGLYLLHIGRGVLLPVVSARRLDTVNTCRDVLALSWFAAEALSGKDMCSGLLGH